MAFHCYLSEGVDAAVIECGIGGEYDSTNIVVKPSVTAVTSLGIDHTAMLGDTIESIAWHKGGVFKAGVPAFTAPQPTTALQALEGRASERKTELYVVPRNSEIDNVPLGLAADFQKTNASLAIAVASAYLNQHRPEAELPADGQPLPDPFRQGLEKAHIGGRCETREDKSTNLTWYIDGGHTLESIEMAGRWFASLISPSTSDSAQGKQPATRILIFNQQTRDASSLAKRLHSTLASALANEKPFTHAIFCTNTTYTETGFRPDLTSINTNAVDIDTLSVQNALAKTWAEVDPSADAKVVRTIEEAIAIARSVAQDAKKATGEEVKALVTGSLHLVGGVLEVLESEVEAAKTKTDSK